MARPHLLKGLVVDEVSLVDSPANRGAVHLLFKRAPESTMTDEEIADAFMKRSFSDDERTRFAASGASMPDGSFPIANVADLHNAIKAVGRAKDPEAAKRHIKTRAKALGALAALPETWKAAETGTLDRLLARLGLMKRGSGTIDPDTYSGDVIASIDAACTALSKSIDSILADATIIDKTNKIAEQLSAFRDFTAGASADQIEKAMRDVAQLAKTGKDDTMPTADEQIATLKDTVAKLSLEVAKATMSAKHKAHMDSLSGQDAKDAFAAKSSADRDAACASDTAKRAIAETTDPTLLAQLTKQDSEIADLRKTVATFEAERELAVFAKRASEAGVGEAQAEVLLKASKGDATAFEALLGMLKGATTAAKTGVVFKEFGAGAGTGVASAAGEVAAAAEQLRKAEPTLSIVAAKVRVRKANTELAQRERDEERRGLSVAV